MNNDINDNMQDLCKQCKLISELQGGMLRTRVGRRGFYEEDKGWFSDDAILKLKKAQEEVEWLLDRGYNSNAIMQLVGGNYQFSTRQRDALKRSTSSKHKCQKRKSTLLPISAVKDGYIYIDGFNLIITLEVALSGGTLILGNDGTIRDVAGLRGTYHIIDKTDKALILIGKMLQELKVPGVKFFLDAPVSNSGRLKTRILQHSSSWKFDIEVELVPNPDLILCKMGRIVTSDSIILDECLSWFNISREVINNYIKDARVVDLSGK